MGLACNPIEGIKKSDFKKLFGIKGKKRLQSNWDQYRYAPDKFFDRVDVQAKLREQGLSKAPIDERIFNSFSRTLGDSAIEQIAQFSTEFGFEYKGVISPDLDTKVFHSKAGTMGMIIGKIVSLLPFL